MEIAVLIGLAILIIVLVSISFGGGKNRARTQKVTQPITKSSRTCPLCGSALAKGERVRSVFYPSPGDTLAEIYGCRYCEGERAEQRRICPVCKKIIADGGHVIARVFKRPGKTHIHVLGCTGCRPTGKSKTTKDQK